MGSDLFQLTGKTALVTGGGSGLGRAISLGLSDAGARVVAADISLTNAEETASLVKGAGGEALAEQLDVTKKANVEQVLERAIEKWGAVDILVNCAGRAIRGRLLSTPKRIGTPSSM